MDNNNKYTVIKSRLAEYKSVAFFSKILCFILLTSVFGIYHSYVEISSDTTTTLPMSIDILNGNLFLHDWVLGTNNFYFTEIVIYALGKLFGFSNLTLLYWIPSIAWVILFLCFLRFLNPIISKNNRFEKIWYVVFVLCVVLIVPPSSAYTLLNANSHNNLYALISVYLILISLYIDKNNLQYLFLPTLLAALLSFSEGVTAMALFAPIICVCVVRIISQPDERNRFSFLLISVVISYLGGKIIFKIFEIFGGMQTIGYKTTLSDFSIIPERLIGWVSQFSILLGMSNFFNTPMEIHKFCVIILMAMLLIALIYYLLHAFKLDWELQFLLFATVINFAACIFSSAVIFHRYIVIGFYCGYFLLGFFIVNVFRKNVPKTKKAVYVFLCVFTLVFAWNKIINIIEQDKKNVNTQEIANCIIDNNLGDGYADFWCASVVSFFTDYNNQISPIFIMNDEIKKYSELIDRKWYGKHDIHYIITFADGHSSFIDTETMLSILGQADKDYVIGEYKLYYWNHDISEYVNNGLSDFILLPQELYQNENVESNKNMEVLHTGAIVYGPYDFLEAGEYLVTVDGSNLDILDYDVWSCKYNRNYPCNQIVKSDESIKYIVTLDKNVEDIEFRLFNSSDEDASYLSVILERIVA